MQQGPDGRGDGAFDAPGWKRSGKRGQATKRDWPERKPRANQEQGEVGHGVYHSRTLVDAMRDMPGTSYYDWWLVLSSCVRDSAMVAQSSSCTCGSISLILLCSLPEASWECTGNETSRHLNHAMILIPRMGGGMGNKGSREHSTVKFETASPAVHASHVPRTARTPHHVLPTSTGPCDTT